jgi:hypothetical protein
MSQISFRIPRAYKDLGVSFFLHLDPSTFEKLKRHHVTQTRRMHPDLLPPQASTEEREEREAQLSALNAAFLRLRDRSSRIDLVIEQVLADNPNIKLSEKPQLPTAMAIEYFELQEALEDKPNAPDTQEELRKFRSELVQEVDRLASEIDTLAAEIHSSDSLSTSLSSETAVLPRSPIEKLVSLRGRERYLTRLLDDINSKAK